MAKGKSGVARWVFRAEQAFADRRLRVRAPGKLPPPAPRAPGDTSAPLLCKAVFEEVCILANGEVVCSCADSVGLRVYGNIRQQPLAEILAGPMYREIREWQLASKPDRWCPVLAQDCPLRVTRATPLDTVAGRLPKMLQLEPTSHCNLKCPACPVTEFDRDPRFAHDRTGLLSMDEMVGIFEALPSLEKVLFYNYGEAFVHPEALPILRWIREHRPGMLIHISTNGIALTPARVRDVVAERLVDRMLFAIDGARPESYARYRVGGKLERALGAMRNMVAEAEKQGVRDRFEIWWQYILFEWNDSDEEIAEARALAAEIGVPIEWVVTHTPGASQRFLPGSDALAALVGGERAFRALSCDLKGAEIVRAGGYEAIRHRATIRPATAALAGAPGEVLLLPVTVRHEGLAPWGGDDGTDFYRVGVRLLDADGKVLDEVWGGALPAGLVPGEETVMFPRLRLPELPGKYHFLFDVVEEGVCWFLERGSTPATLELEVSLEATLPESARPAALLVAAVPHLRSARLGDRLWGAEQRLLAGDSIEDILVALRNAEAFGRDGELALRARIGASLMGHSEACAPGNVALAG